LIISHLAGDAVLSYGLGDHFLSGQVFIESIEDTYVAFRNEIHFMVMNSSCKCNACANLSLLDLKFFVHYGSFALQKINQNDELIGSDVNLVHRLLKNHVTEATGCRAYTLYTEAAIRHLGIEELEQKMFPHKEAYEHLGEVQTWIQDMHPAWEIAQNTSGELLPASNVLASAEIEIAASLQSVWEYAILPEYRSILTGADYQDISHVQDGRIAPGSVYHCYHGDEEFQQTVVSWKPFEFLTTRNRIPIPMMNTFVLFEIKLAAGDSGTRLVISVSKPGGSFIGQRLVSRMMPKMIAETHANLIRFKARVESDLKARGVPVKAAASPSEMMLAQAVRESLVPAALI
jgi:hypothetical protein